jgi:hypothetical protein
VELYVLSYWNYTGSGSIIKRNILELCRALLETFQQHKPADWMQEQDIPHDNWDNLKTHKEQPEGVEVVQGLKVPELREKEQHIQ